MYKNRAFQRTFFRAPQSVTALFAACLEPALIVATFLATCWAFDEPIGRSDLTLCFLVLALTFPGRERFGERPLNAAVDIATSWVGFFVHAKTSEAVVARLNAAIVEILRTPDVQAKLQTMGLEPTPGTAAQAQAFFKSEIDNWGKMVRAIGATVE